MRQRKLPSKQAAERGAAVSPSKDAAFISDLCPADGGAGRPGRVILNMLEFGMFFADRTEQSARFSCNLERPYPSAVLRSFPFPGYDA